MDRVGVAAWAVLLKLKTVWIVTTVLARDVVTVLAVLARHRGLRTNVVLCHRVHLPLGPLRTECSSAVRSEGRT